MTDTPKSNRRAWGSFCSWTITIVIMTTWVLVSAQAPAPAVILLWIGAAIALLLGVNRYRRADEEEFQANNQKAP